MTTSDTQIVDLDAYRQTPFDPDDFPNVGTDVEVVEWHPDEDPRWNNDILLAEIAALRTHIEDGVAGSQRQFDRTDLALTAVVAFLAGALALSGGG